MVAVTGRSLFHTFKAAFHGELTLFGTPLAINRIRRDAILIVILKLLIVRGRRAEFVVKGVFD